jgi:hypothetical protein
MEIKIYFLANFKPNPITNNRTPAITTNNTTPEGENKVCNGNVLAVVLSGFDEKPEIFSAESLNVGAVLPIIDSTITIAIMLKKIVVIIAFPILDRLIYLS